jgi:hypothetical protein
MDTRSKLNVQDRIKQFFKDHADDINPKDNTPKVIDNVDSEIELLDDSQPIASSSKGKGVLTSPSLENLNNQAEES